ncbi:STAS domain-containing protein [Spirillospora sp. NPDC048911]|uniref:STAS domain-containing protein n=1 Tax=Spirillospora sp. NPDC048911 TaxID=3364527 RepID=UPI0037150461
MTTTMAAATGTGTGTSTRRPRAPAEVTMPTRRRPGHTIVALHGALDIAAAPALREHLAGMLGHSPRHLTLDLGEVSFCDTSGLAVLIGTQRRATGLGITLRLTGLNPQVTKLLRITGLDHALTVNPAPHPTPLPSPTQTRTAA